MLSRYQTGEASVKLELDFANTTLYASGIMVLTQDDIQALKEAFATKDDLKQFVTKDDLNQLSTMLDKKLEAQSKEFDKKLTQQKTDLLHEVDLKLVKLGRDIDQKLEKQKTEIITAVADTIHDSLLPLLDNHEDRIERLEKNAGLTPLPLSGR